MFCEWLLSLQTHHDSAGQEEFVSSEAAEAARVLPQRLEELTEGQLGDMGEACRAAGLESLFLLALKIERCDTSTPTTG
jgi:hypothetical protein